MIKHGVEKEEVNGVEEICDYLCQLNKSVRQEKVCCIVYAV